MDIIADLLKATGNEYASTVEDMGEPLGFLDTGSYMFNGLISGSIFKGFPIGRVSMLAGPEATGKSYFILNVIKNFLESDPRALVIYFETESAIDKDTMAERGVDIKRVLYIPVTTVEEFRTQCVRILDKYLGNDQPEEADDDSKQAKSKQPKKQPKRNQDAEKDRPPLLIALDSLGNLSTNAEIDNAAAGKDTRDMSRSQLIKAVFRIITLKLGRAKSTLLVANHTYDQIGAQTKPGMPPPQQMSGGSGGKYAASTIVYLSKKKDYDEKIKETVGNFIHCKLVKSRFTKPDRMVDVSLSYTKGLAPHYGLLDLVKDYEIWPVAGGKFETPFGKFYQSAIYADPQRFFTEDVMQLLDGAAAKEFMYGTDPGEFDVPVSAEEEE